MTTIIEERRDYLPNAAATLAVGARLALCLHGGMIVTVSGDLGAGKTTLVRGLLRGLGWAGPVKSPSYTLVEHYSVSSLYLYHFDFYRFGDPGEWEDTGFNEYFRPDSICVIEWPERVVGMLPAADLIVRLAPSGAGRSLFLGAQTAAGSACLASYPVPP